MRKATSHGSTTVQGYSDMNEDGESKRDNEEAFEDEPGCGEDSGQDFQPASDIRKRHAKKKAKG